MFICEKIQLKQIISVLLIDSLNGPKVCIMLTCYLPVRRLSIYLLALAQDRKSVSTVKKRHRTTAYCCCINICFINKLVFDLYAVATLLLYKYMACYLIIYKLVCRTVNKFVLL